MADAPDKDETPIADPLAPTADGGDEGAAEESYPELDLVSPQFTIRAIVTGMLLGALLSFCNIYSGLKIGWGFNMSITAALLSYGFWQALSRTANTRKWGLLENNINQTTASSAANISSAGLVAPIPALTILTGEKLGWTTLAIWTFAVSVVGVVVAIGLRRQFLLVDKLAFPSGIATAETVKEMYARGSEAIARVLMLLVGGVIGAGLKLLGHFLKWSPIGIPGAVKAKGAGATAGKYTLHNLGFAIDPSLLMVAVGAIIGIRAGWSMLLGAIVSWGFLGPWVLDQGWAEGGKPDAPWFGPMNKWMLWPGVAMMVTASLTSFAFSWRSVVNAISGTRHAATDTTANARQEHEVPRKLFLVMLAVALVLATITQTWFFPIALWTAVVAVLLTFVLAIVAGRVSGETGITPVGPMGKVTQLAFGVIAPGNPAANLMAANVTGGAASQTADLLHDMKTGLLIGASPRFQAFAQFFGVLAGALAGSAAYMVLIPDPKKMLLTNEWPAPAVAAWKAVAEIFAKGFDTMPQGAVTAMIIAGAAGVVLAVAEKVAPKKVAVWIPSPASVGLAFVIPAWYAISMFIGGLAAVFGNRFFKSWTARFMIVLAAGIIAGESLAGVGLAIENAVTYLRGGG